MASALDHIHSHGLVHLDVKPDNIFRGLAPLPGAQMLASSPDRRRSGSISPAGPVSGAAGQVVFKLGDFGLATALDGHLGCSEGDSRCGFDLGFRRVGA
jgi:serine/threonine protein kinase